MTKQNNEQQPQLLDLQTFNEIAGAFARLQALGDNQIVSTDADNTQAEREQLIAYLAEALLKHIAQFLGAWQLCNLEYMPLLRSLQAVAKRAGYQPTPQVNNQNN